MKAAPIVPAVLAFDVDGLPFSAEFNDIYHPKSGALNQARHVFIAGNGLPRRWQRREDFVVLETGFGLGNNFLATWQAWRDDPLRCERLVFISIEHRPFTSEDLAKAHRESPLPELRDELLKAWPPLTHNLHALSFECGRVRLLLAFGDVQSWLPELIASVDAFLLDGFAPIANPRMWDERVCKALGRLAAREATLATWSAARAVRGYLTTAGFEVRLGQGQGGKRDIILADFTPRFEVKVSASRRSWAGGGSWHSPSARSHPGLLPDGEGADRSAFAQPSLSPEQEGADGSRLARLHSGVHSGQGRPRDEGSNRRVMIIGGGLAGCAAACALAEHGWSSVVIERRSRIASEASGNAAGLFHGIVNSPDSPHARFNRAAAFEAHRAVQLAIDRHGVRGSTQGLLRIETSMDVESMKAMILALGLPSDYLQALDAAHASAISAVPLMAPAWFYPGGGWVEPAGLARSLLERAGPLAELRLGTQVHALRRIDQRWQALDFQSRVLAEAPTVVLANAVDSLRLLGNPDWPIESIRGQLSSIAVSKSAFDGPRLPIAGSGYLLPEIDGRLIFGATANVNDGDPTVRAEDHRSNIAQLERLTGRSLPIDVDALQGRTAWRLSSIDRLPLVGAVPDDSSIHQRRMDQPRFVQREQGLYVFAALGSRGITWSALCGQVLAAMIAGAPVPLEASLVDAIDPARFASRKARRSGSV